MNEEVAEAFKFFDTIGDSKIAVYEVGPCLRVLGHTPTEEQIANLTKNWINNKDARISIEEFLPMVISLQKERNGPEFTEKDYIEAFSQLDREGSGFIQSTEIKFMLMHMGERLTQEEVEQTLFGFVNADGKVDIDKYVSRMCDRDAEF
ncbi:Myosin-2 essential light chain [Toxocara canis]|uniref:Myosin-2 essential light chain n=1 Tax=Toxocara canis TaxID=6265 RepID=A0A0B2UZT6_TOXCA|nr:Myosin-2 essential light chain [Toxocara canis]